MFVRKNWFKKKKIKTTVPLYNCQHRKIIFNLIFEKYKDDINILLYLE